MFHYVLPSRICYARNLKVPSGIVCTKNSCCPRQLCEGEDTCYEYGAFGGGYNDCIDGQSCHSAV